ncbi:MAG: hypothetical protein ABF646_02115 [Acetobacter papayae]
MPRPCFSSQRAFLATHASKVALPPENVLGVPHPDRSEEQSLADMRRADATSWQYCRPAGVTAFFQRIE